MVCSSFTQYGCCFFCFLSWWGKGDFLSPLILTIVASQLACLMQILRSPKWSSLESKKTSEGRGSAIYLWALYLWNTHCIQYCVCLFWGSVTVCSAACIKLKTIYGSPECFLGYRHSEEVYHCLPWHSDPHIPWRSPDPTKYTSGLTLFYFRDIWKQVCLGYPGQGRIIISMA